MSRSSGGTAFHPPGARCRMCSRAHLRHDHGRPLTPTARERGPQMKAIRRFTVAAALPEPLASLGELMMNLRWSWHAETLALFAEIDAERWEASGNDPVRMLGEVPPEQLARLAEDRRFLRRLSNAADDLREYLSEPR